MDIGRTDADSRRVNIRRICRIADSWLENRPSKMLSRDKSWFSSPVMAQREAMRICLPCRSI